MANSVYVSFDPADSAGASAMAAFLEQRGLSCTLAPGGGGPTTEGAMALYFTDVAKTSSDILRDFKVAVARGISIVGLRIAAGFLPSEIDMLSPRVEWINAIVGKPEAQFERVADTLARLVNQTLTAEPHIVFEAPTSPVMRAPEPASRPTVVTPPPVADSYAPADEEQQDDPGAPYGVVLANAGHNQIEVIKLVREVTGLGLKEAKDLVDSAPVCITLAATRDAAEGLASYFRSARADIHIEPNWTDEDALAHVDQREIAIAPPVVVDPPRATPQLDVLLTSPGVQKLSVIKVVRDLTGLGLAECKDIVEGPMPVTLVRADPDLADRVRDLLYAAGAGVSIVDASPATAPHFLRRPVTANQGCQTSVISAGVIVAAGIAATIAIVLNA